MLSAFPKLSDTKVTIFVDLDHGVKALEPFNDNHVAFICWLNSRWRKLNIEGQSSKICLLNLPLRRGASGRLWLLRHVEFDSQSKTCDAFLY